MRLLVVFSLLVASLICGHQFGKWRTEQQASAKAQREIRDFFNINAIQTSSEPPQFVWDTQLPLPIGFRAAYESRDTALGLNVGADSNQVLAYCQPVYGKQHYVIIYRNGLVMSVDSLPEL